MQWLLREGGASIEEVSNNGFTALLKASFKGHLPVVQWLLREGGSSIEETSLDGSTDVWQLLEWPSNPAFYEQNGLAPSPLCKTMLLCGEPSEMKGEEETDSRLALISRAEMLRAALPGWRGRRAEAVVGCESLPTSFMRIVAHLSEPSEEEVWSELLAVGPPRGTKRRAEGGCDPRRPRSR